MTSGAADFADLTEQAPCGYLVIGAAGRIEYVNGTIAKWIGRKADEMVGRRFGEILTLPGRIYFETHIAPLLRMQGTFEEFAIDLTTTDGSPVAMIANANERRDASGASTGLRVALIKATDRRRYERELLEARESARAAEGATQELLRREHESSKLREQFIAVLGHDLRNPLASIDAGVRILSRSVQSAKDRHIVTMLQSTVQRMASMIDNILDFARGRLGGGIGLGPTEDVALEPVLGLVVDELRLSSPGRLIESRFQIGRTVRCDQIRIGQLLSNLIGNALTHGASDLPVVVEAKTSNTAFVLSVSNAGEAIPPESLSKLFEPFVRGEVRGNAQGLGLGLYIASQIATAHGGRISVQSTSERTTFTLEMPLSA